MVELIDRIQNIFGKVTQVEASFKVQVVATHFRDTTNIYLPKTPFDKLQLGMQFIKAAKIIRKIKNEAKENSDVTLPIY